jgi:hypothetical protein
MLNAMKYADGHGLGEASLTDVREEREHDDRGYAAIPLPATAHFIDPDRILSNGELSTCAT